MKEVKIILIALILFFVCNPSFAQTNSIGSLFKDFQTGYSKRDTSQATSFSKSLFTKDIVIIGTGNDEWVEGINDAKKLVSNDWAYWLNLSVDPAKLTVVVHGNSASFAIRGTAYISFPSKEAAYDYAYTRIQQLTNSKTSSRNKVLSYSREASDLIKEIESGSLDIKYSIRLAGSLLMQNGRWYFSELVYSFPYPMNRE
jgi:hypothetical protein